MWYLGASLQFAASRGGQNGTVYLDDIKLVTTPRLIEGKEPVALTTTTVTTTTTTQTTTTSAAAAGGTTAVPVASAGGGGGATQTVLIIVIVILVVALVGLAVKHYQLRQSMNGGYNVSDASVSSSTADVRNSAPSPAAAGSYDNPIYGEGDRYGSVGRGR